MAKKSNINDLREQTESLYQEYQARFAGMPRATRDLDALDSIIDRLEAAIEAGRELQNGGRDPALQSMLEQATENLEVYEDERAAIQKVQSGDPANVEASLLATWANLTFGKYYRHFAGKPRQTRDLGLLNELISQLESVEDDMESLVARRPVESTKQDLKTVRNNLEMYRDEREAIISARSAGDLDEQASYLAIVANEQFAIYQHHFAGKPRISRRPGLLRRVVLNLEGIQDRMNKLADQGLNSPENTKNIGVIADQLDTYRDELDQIENARRQTAPDELAGHLGSAANAAMQNYHEQFAGKDRRGRDLTLLTRICDEMYDIALQMQELGDETEGIENDKNLNIVLDNLMMYQNEYEQIEKVQE